MVLSQLVSNAGSSRSFNFGCVALLAAWFVSACDSGPQNNAPPPVIGVEVAAAERRDVPLMIELTGSTYGNQDVPIRARVEGFLLTMDFREGRMVDKGDLLYTIDPDPFQAKVVEARSSLAAEETRYAKAKADLDRIRPLAEINAVSQQQLDAAVAQEAAAAAGVKAARARLDLANIELSYTEIYAPIDGLIGLTQAKPGEFVGKDPNPVVLNTLSDIDPIRVRFAISEREYLQLARTASREQGRSSEGYRPEPDEEATTPLVLILADGTEYEETGIVDALSQSIDPATGTFSIEATFPNPKGILLPGQFARVRAIYETRKDAVVVPRQAISELQGLFRVYVVGNDDVISTVEVTPGPVTGNDIIITQGLRGGERVVAEGVQKVRPGMTVEPLPYTPRDVVPVDQEL